MVEISRKKKITPYRVNRHIAGKYKNRQYVSPIKNVPVKLTQKELLLRKALSMAKFDKLHKEFSNISLHINSSKKQSPELSQRDLALKEAILIDQIENLCYKSFKVNLGAENIVALKLNSSKNSFTTIFTTHDKLLYALCVGDEFLQFADVKNIIESMGMVAEKYLPPNADKKYFIKFGEKKFQYHYPSHNKVTPKQTKFYQTLAPYSPALVRIKKIKGPINKYDNLNKKWQKAFDYSYQHIKVKFK